MCKVLMIAGIKENTVEKAWKFARAMAKPMSTANRDGLGYAAITAEGQLFGERWLNNDQAFRKFIKSDKLDEQIISALDGAIETVGVRRDTGEIEYNTFGEVNPKKAVAITMHTRMATSAKGMVNVHPFVENGISLIHNGVISNTEDFKFRVSTCDSEAILQAYQEQKIRDNPQDMTKAAGMLRGYYACGVLTNTSEGPILDVFKDKRASLHAAYVEQLETYVFATSDYDIKEVCRELGYSIGTVFVIRGGKLMRINATSGTKRLIQDFDSSDKPYNSQYGNGSSYSPRHSRTFHESGRSNSSGQHGVSDTGGNGTGTKALAAGKSSGIADVLHIGKNKVKAADSKGLLAYCDAGRPVCVKVSERDIAEEIMNMDRASRA